MPIKGFADRCSIPRVGKIYLGVKQVSARTNNEYPVAVDYFVVRADDKATSEAAAKAFRDVYGEQPRAIKVMFPSDNPAHFFPQWLKAYGERGGKSQLYCKGDAETAQRRTETGWVDIPCPYKECELYQAKKCKELGQLQFFLPDVKMLGIWQLDTTSYHSMSNLNDTINMVRLLNDGRIKMIPLTLRVVPLVVSPEGKAKTVYVLQLDVENVNLMDILSHRPLTLNSATTGESILDPIEEDEIPTELYPPSKWIVDEEKTTVPKNTNLSGQAQPTAEPSPSHNLKTVSQDDLTDLSNVGAIADLQIRPSNGGKTVAKLVLAMADTGESKSVVTDEPRAIETLKNLPIGKLLQFQSAESERFQLPYLTTFAIVS